MTVKNGFTFIYEATNGKTHEFTSLVPVRELDIDFSPEYNDDFNDELFHYRRISTGAWLTFKVFLPHITGVEGLYTQKIKESEEAMDVFVDRVPDYLAERLTTNKIEEIGAMLCAGRFMVTPAKDDEPLKVTYFDHIGGAEVQGLEVTDRQIVVVSHKSKGKHKVRVFDEEEFYKKFELKLPSRRAIL